MRAPPCRMIVLPPRCTGSVDGMVDDVFKRVDEFADSNVAALPGSMPRFGDPPFTVASALGAGGRGACSRNDKERWKAGDRYAKLSWSP